MSVPEKISKHNFRAFLWHAGFLALAQNFMDVDTIIPAMLVESGGTAFHVGLMAAIMMGGSSFTQLFFAPHISSKAYKKKIILTGINARLFSLIALGIMLYTLKHQQNSVILLLAFLFITIFSLGGAYANIGYVDIVGKAIHNDKRKRFFSSRQIINGIAVILSAFLAKQVLTLKAFPVNYAYSFFIGGILLLVASGGFWSIREHIASDFKIGTLKHFFQILRSEIRQNKKLKYFLGFINTQGIAISFLPFIILYAKDTFNAQAADTGSFLISKVSGLVFVGLLVLLFSHRVKYRLILVVNVLLTIVMALLVLVIQDLSVLRFVFILGGMIFSLYSISMNGVLLEISGTQKRSIYVGFAGAGNILPALFPLFGGWLIEQFGFRAFVIFFILIVSAALFFIKKINCQV
ncbi:MAG: MFS transporter [Bacteroidota bacterium]|nr:MFS transporter [Bacteroidota bacterium]